MKKTFRTIISAALILCLALGFSSCTLFSTMREYSMKASRVDIIPTPEDEALYAEFNKALENSVSEAVKMDTSVSYNAKNIDVSNADDSAKLLNKAAGTINKLILANKPGAKSSTTEPVDLKDTLLENFDAASALSYTASRNTANEAVTNEKGEEMTAEDGTVLREVKIKDNFVKVQFLFYNDVVTEEAHTDEEGSDVAEVTERVLADDAAIEAVFGSPADKEAVLAEFDAIRDYIQVKDYTFIYDTCKVSAQTDLAADHVLDVSFEKVMKVTAAAEGVGALADYGELTVTFDVIRNDNYSFTYLEAEE